MGPLVLLAGIMGGVAVAALWPRKGGASATASDALQRLAAGAQSAGAALQSAGQTVADTAVALTAPNLTLEEGETFSPGMRSWFVGLALALAPLHIYVTDGTRTARDQALAMLAKATDYDAAVVAGKTPVQSDDLRWLYHSAIELIDQLLASGRDVDTWERLISEAMARGLYVSRHLRGDAADVRTRDHSAAEVAQIRAEAEARGAETLIESDHLHIQRIPGAL